MMMMILGVVISVYVIAEIFHSTTITTSTLVNYGTDLKSYETYPNKQ